MILLASPVVVILIAALGLAALVWLVRLALLLARWNFLRGRVVLITGASRGIGRALALACAKRGAHLALASRNKEQLEGVAAECRGAGEGIQTLVVPVDVTDQKQVERMVAQTIEKFGRIDVLINNAGIIQGGALAEISAESIRKQFEVNVMSAFWVTRLVVRQMQKQGQGHIVIMSSAIGRACMPYFTVYTATKHALNGLGDSLRAELNRTRIRVMNLNPGYVQTDIVTHVQRSYKKMGFVMLPPDLVARRALEGMALGQAEVNVGWLETLGGWANSLFPGFINLYWRVLMPGDFPENASRQITE